MSVSCRRRLGGFSALALEDPFGTDANDMPMMGFTSTSEHLRDAASPWMLKDQWINDGNGGPTEEG